MSESFSTRLTKAWFEGAIWPRFLLPLSALFALIYYVRRFLYAVGLKKSYASSVPVIVVGNITVGGAGKSPLVAHIAAGLREIGLTPGIVSRGYGARDPISEPLMVQEGSSADQVGDEPLMLFQQTACPVVVCPERRLAVEMLVKHGCDVVLADDGLQHLAMQRDIEICVLDAQRLWGNRLLLPAGPLREPLPRLWTKDFIVLNGEADAPAKSKFRLNHLTARASGVRPNLYRMQLKPSLLISLDGTETRSIESFESQHVLACAGIGNPSRFFHTLVELGMMFEPKSFADHHQFVKEDFDAARDRPIIMTSKDAVKCRSLGLENAWYLPVEAELDRPLISDILSKLADAGRIEIPNIR